jgi:hypothetical protein
MADFVWLTEWLCDDVWLFVWLTEWLCDAVWLTVYVADRVAL